MFVAIIVSLALGIGIYFAFKKFFGKINKPTPTGGKGVETPPRNQGDDNKPSD